MLTVQELLRGAGKDHLSTVVSTLGAHINYPVRRRDQLQPVFHHDDRIPLIHEAL